ncbi:hypothetical protein LP421_28320 [Rhizobium sp. RCAM05350]|nr:hypothetical protein LP421_28320 [Rhizobium sp. RCAM05350]
MSETLEMMGLTASADFFNSFGTIRDLSNYGELHLTLSAAGTIGTNIAAGLGGSITGSNGNDTVDVSAATVAFTVYGNEGNDTITTGATNDTIDGGEGDDTINGGDGKDQIYGGGGINILNGGAGDDVIGVNAYDSENTINAGAGDDIIEINATSENNIDGGEGDDILRVQTGDIGATTAINVKTLEMMGLTASADFFNSFGTIRDLSNYGELHLTLSAAGTIGTNIAAGPGGSITGSNSNDTVDVSAATVAFTVYGNEGNDTLRGGGANDTLHGGGDDDDIDGGGGSDTIHGGDGVNILKGGAGNDQIFTDYDTTNTIDAGDGDDVIDLGGVSVNTIDGGDGTDIVRIYDADFGTSSVANVEILEVGRLTASAAMLNSFTTIRGNDGYFGSDTIHLTLASAGNVGGNIATGVGGTLIGSGGNDGIDLSAATAGFDIDGGAGDDTLRGGLGNDVIDGGDGIDTAGFSGAFADYAIALKSPGVYEVKDTHNDAPNGRDTLSDVEFLQFSDQTYDLGVNVAPSDIVLSSQQAPEDRAAGGLIAAIDGTDGNGDPLSYTLTDDPSGLFRISGNQLLLRTGATLNFETATSHQITIKASDGQGGTFSKTFTISVTDFDEAPTSVQLSKATVAENSAVDTTIGTLSAVDPEGKALTYTLTDNAGGLFKLSGNALQLVKAVNYETLKSDTITVEVSDGVNKALQTFTIGITDVNEGPSVPTLSESNGGGELCCRHDHQHAGFRRPGRQDTDLQAD